MTETGVLLRGPSRPRDLGLRSTALPMAATRVAGLGGEFVAFALIARDLGPAGFGRLSAAFVVARYLGILADWGATLGGSRLLASDEPEWQRVAELVRWRLVVSVALAASLAAALLVVSPALTPVALTVVCRGLNRDWISLGLGHGVRAGASSVVQGAALLIGAIWLLGGTLRGAACVLAVGYVVGAGASLVLNRVRTPVVTGESADAGPRTPWLAVMQVADQFLLTADTVLLVALGTVHAAGIYAAICRISTSFLTAQGLIVAGLVPGVTRALAADGPDALAAVRRRCRRAGVGLGASVLLLAVPAVWVLPRVFGSSFEDGRSALVVLLVSVAVSACTIPLFPVVVAQGRDRRLAVVTAIVAAANVAANLVVIPRWSFEGAAVVMLASQCAISANYLLMARTRVPRVAS